MSCLRGNLVFPADLHGQSEEIVDQADSKYSARTHVEHTGARFIQIESVQSESAGEEEEQVSCK